MSTNQNGNKDKKLFDLTDCMLKYIKLVSFSQKNHQKLNMIFEVAVKSGKLLFTYAV